MLLCSVGSQISGQTLLEGAALSHTKKKVLQLKVIFSMDSDLNKGKRTGDRSCLLGTHGMCAAELHSWEKKSVQWETNNYITRRVKQCPELYSVQELALGLSQSLEKPETRTWISSWALLQTLLTPLQDQPGAMSECFSLSTEDSLTRDHKDAVPQRQAPHY